MMRLVTCVVGTISLCWGAYFFNAYGIPALIDIVKALEPEDKDMAFFIYMNMVGGMFGVLYYFVWKEADR